MISINKNDHLDIQNDDGIWTDYKDHTWLFYVKDSVWTEEEKKRAEHSEIDIAFVQKGIVDLFLLSIFDCMEPSDIPFCIKDGDEEMISSLADKQDYAYEIILVREDNTAAAVRNGVFDHVNSNLLKKSLLQRMQEPATSDDFDRDYSRLSASCEPYEFEDSAVFIQKDRRQ